MKKYLGSTSSDGLSHVGHSNLQLNQQHLGQKSSDLPSLHGSGRQPHNRINDINPPFSLVDCIAIAIESSAKKSLKKQEIVEFCRSNFEFFTEKDKRNRTISSNIIGKALTFMSRFEKDFLESGYWKNKPDLYMKYNRDLAKRYRVLKPKNTLLKTFAEENGKIFEKMNSSTSNSSAKISFFNQQNNSLELQYEPYPPMLSKMPSFCSEATSAVESFSDSAQVNNATVFDNDQDVHLNLNNGIK